MSRFSMYEVQVEYQRNPMGLDVARPHFLWKVRRQAGDGVWLQEAFRIRVAKEGGDEVWDSGWVISGESAGICYEGAALEPCTRYSVSVTARSRAGDEVSNGDAWFETGFLDPTVKPWGGAEWIGAPEKYVRSDTMGVFALETGFRLEEGSGRAGIVFGAGDARLMDARKNQYQIAGENYIRYEIDASGNPAMLRIFRVGYHPDDRADRPLAEHPLTGFETDGPCIITEENRYREHSLRIEVTGNCAFTYVDGILTDAVVEENFFGKKVEGRQLNPLGSNDITTFPRLNEIGYYAGPGDAVWFSGLKVKNYRTPKAVVASLDPEGIRLEGGETGRMLTKRPDRHSLPMFRSRFSIGEKAVERARLYITARGIYDCRINGKPVTDTWLNPGSSQYDRHLMYQVYDVGDLLKKGENGIGVTLASGWWCDAQTFVVKNYNYYGDREAFLARLEIVCEDGEKICLTSNTEDWECLNDGPYLYAGLFQGEQYDARIAWKYDKLSVPEDGQEGSGGVRPVVITPAVIEASRTMPVGFGREWPRVDHGRMKLVGGLNSPVTEVCRLSAKAVTSPRDGLYIYDMGQEMAGVPRIRFHGKAGEMAVIRYGEMLYPDLPEYEGLAGTMLTENYRDAESIDKYTLRGDPEGEIFCPRFTFHGFRYIEVTGLEQAPAPEEVEAVQLSSIPEITGELGTSHGLLNRFIENVKWSQLCNFISIPTDCPQRNERMGWAGDTHVFCRTATYQSDARIFYYRYLQALRDLQEENGQLPEIAPVGGGFGGITYECAMIFMVWELYQQYGDTGVIAEYYDSMRAWLEYIHGAGMPGEAFVGPINDWLAPEETDNGLIWNAFYFRSVDLFARMAAAAGRQEDAALFADRAARAKEYWNEHFVDPETGKMRGMDGKENDTQCAYALPLAYEVLEDKYRDKAYENLARHTREVGCTVQTGFFGTGLISPMLSRGGYADVAYDLMLQTAYPSWLYPVTQGATTIWERWNSYTKEAGFGGNNAMNSFNHYSLGSVLSWMYEYVLGIQRDEDHPGYRHFTLRPQIRALAYAGGGFETVYGRIESRWERTEKGGSYTCTVPCNATADLILEYGGRKLHRELTGGTWTFEL